MKDALEIIRAREQAEDVKRLEGYHLLLDAEGPAPTQHAVHEYMLTMAAVLGMTVLSPALVIETKQGGMTGMLIIAESHISVHFQPPHQYAIDVFSCKRFDSGPAVAFTVQHFRLTHEQVRLINRGEVPVAVNTSH